ncbi:MAG: flagellar export protein FliJ [Holophaga sp.]
MARRFRFRLESLLRLRRSLEENAQRGLARALAQLDQARTRLAQLRQDRMEALESRSLPPGQPVDLERWRAVERWVLALERRIVAAGEDVKEAEVKVAAARQDLVRAHRARLMLERLKERRQEQHAIEQLREEARELDEMAVLRYRFGPAFQEVAP